MAEPPVLEELLAVIRHHHDERVLEEPPLVEPIEEAADALVRVANARVVPRHDLAMLAGRQTLALRFDLAEVLRVRMEAGPELGGTEHLHVLGRSFVGRVDLVRVQK